MTYTVAQPTQQIAVVDVAMSKADYAQQVNHFVFGEFVSPGMPENDDMKNCTTSPIHKQNYGNAIIGSSASVRNG